MESEVENIGISESIYIFYKLTEAQSAQEKSMESTKRHVPGRSIVLERQKRFSIETSERIYIKDTQLDAQRLYHNPPEQSHSSLSSCIEKIHLTRQRVDCLNDQINHEIDRLKEVHSHFKNRNKSSEKIEMVTDKQMTWGESFSANRSKASPLATNRQHGSGRGRRLCSCPGPECKPYCHIVDVRCTSHLKKKELTSREPPPKRLATKEVPPNRFPPKRFPSKERLPKELPPKEHPPKRLPPKDLPPREVPPKRVPLKDLLPKEVPSKDLPTKRFPQKELPPKKPPPKEVPAKKLPPRELQAKRLPPKEVPPKEIPPKEIPPKERLPKELPPKEFPRKPPPKNSTSKELKPAKPPPKNSSSKELKPGKPPPQKPSLKDITERKPLSKDFPPQKPSLKELTERKLPPKSCSQKELNPGKPPPQKPPSKELMTRIPLEKEEPKQKELDLKELTPEELTSEESKLKQLERRVSGGCCPCCYNCPPSYYSTCQDTYCSTNHGCHCVGVQLGCPSYNVGLMQGMQYGIPYSVSARRQHTDLNTQETCRSRNSTPKDMRSQQCSSKQTMSSSLYRSKSRENRSPCRGGRTTENRSSSRARKTTENKNVRRKIKEVPRTTAYQMQRQERLLKVESQEKQMKVQKRGKTLEVESSEKLLKIESQEKIIKVQMLSQKGYPSPPDLKRGKSKERGQKAKVTDVVPPQALGMNKTVGCGVNERMYQDYLRLYYQENSKEDIRRGKPLKEVATYTRLRDKEEKFFKEEPRTRRETRKEPEKPLKHSDRFQGQALSKTNSREEPQRVSRSKDRQKERQVVRPQISIEAFSYDEAPKGKPSSGRNYQEYTDYQTPSSSPQSVPSLFSYKTCNQSPNDRLSPRKAEPIDDYRALPTFIRPTDFHDDRTDRLSPWKAEPIDEYRALPTFIRPMDFHDDRYLKPTGSRAYSPDSKSTRSLAKDRQLVSQERTESSKERVVVHEVPKNVKRDRSPSLKRSKSPHVMESTSSAAPPPKREVVNTQDIKNRKDKSLPSFEKSTQVFQDLLRPQRNLSPESFGAGSSRIRGSSLVSDSSSEKTIVINPHYQPGPKDAQSSEINRDELSDSQSSGEGSDESELESVHFDMKPHVREVCEDDDVDHKHVFPIETGKTERSGNESPPGIIRPPTFNEFKEEKSDYQSWAYIEDPEEAFPRKPEMTNTPRNYSPLRESQSKHKSMLSKVEQEDNESLTEKFLSKNEFKYSPKREKSDYQGWACKQESEEAFRRNPEKTNSPRNDSPLRQTQSKHKSKVEQEDNESLTEIFQSKNEFKDSPKREKSEYQSCVCLQEPEEAFRGKPEKKNDSPLRQTQSKHKSMLSKVEQEDNEHSTKEYESLSLKSRSEHDGYESARSYDPNRSNNSQSSRTYSPQRGGEDKMPIVETVCEKRTRTVTFEDEVGDLEEEEQVEEHCRSRIDWERAFKYRLSDRDQSSEHYYTDDNYTSRSSSSAEHTCIESSCEEGDDYDSCLETLSRTDQGLPPFRACPCMYDTYRNLTALCQNQGPFYR